MNDKDKIILEGFKKEASAKRTLLSGAAKARRQARKAWKGVKKAPEELRGDIRRFPLSAVGISGVAGLGFGGRKKEASAHARWESQSPSTHEVPPKTRKAAERIRMFIANKPLTAAGITAAGTGIAGFTLSKRQRD